MYSLLLDEMAPISFLFNIVSFLFLSFCYIFLIGLLLLGKFRGYQWGMCLAGILALAGLYLLETGGLPIPGRHYFPRFLFPFLVGFLRLLLRGGKHPA
jgi:hypothetical protein